MKDKEEPITEQFILLGDAAEASAFLTTFVPNSEEGYNRYAFHAARLLASGNMTSPHLLVYTSDEYSSSPFTAISVGGHGTVMRFKGGAYVDPFNPNSKAFFDLEEFMAYRAAQGLSVMDVEEEYFPDQTRDEYWDTVEEEEEYEEDYEESDDD